eukprot:CAMPEP_0176070946 /NCGR_PEP_ID=MMETSP0120_2-20121206/35433_1 /TAXON_ID=160619 /ORGANISM="Kryptoperidinium foliaceum, Strain CCMP 1326" /LENGTH=145 /DNA_ID=CAMNT_0017404599 /DNA_START=335 /DNA_END=769 /DNA_ORIENTATION=+
MPSKMGCVEIMPVEFKKSADSLEMPTYVLSTERIRYARPSAESQKSVMSKDFSPSGKSACTHVKGPAGDVDRATPVIQNLRTLNDEGPVIASQVDVLLPEHLAFELPRPGDGLRAVAVHAMLRNVVSLAAFPVPVPPLVRGRLHD